jgi:protein-S-isoprenylcysteine O-methyltransferase Ste14
MRPSSGHFNRVSLSGWEIVMPDQLSPFAAKPFWRRALAGILDFMTVFFVGGSIIAKLSGQTTSNGFSLTGVPALILLATIILYFYFGWNRLGGTIWQRILKAR